MILYCILTHLHDYSNERPEDSEASYMYLGNSVCAYHFRQVMTGAASFSQLHKETVAKVNEAEVRSE